MLKRRGLTEPTRRYPLTPSHSNPTFGSNETKLTTPSSGRTIEPCSSSYWSRPFDDIRRFRPIPSIAYRGGAQVEPLNSVILPAFHKQSDLPYSVIACAERVHAARDNRRPPMRCPRDPPARPLPGTLTERDERRDLHIHNNPLPTNRIRLAHSPSRPLSGGCAGPLLTNVDVEARATSARKDCARRPVLQAAQQGLSMPCQAWFIVGPSNNTQVP